MPQDRLESQAVAGREEVEVLSAGMYEALTGFGLLGGDALTGPLGHDQGCPACAGV